MRLPLLSPAAFAFDYATPHAAAAALAVTLIFSPFSLLMHCRR